MPMAIVWPCTITAHDYAAAGREVEVPRPSCPSCRARMTFHGFYRRPLRVGEEILRLVVRRARCRVCRTTHALLPDFVCLFRLDQIETIGEVIGKMAAKGRALLAGVPETTARDWCRRFRARAALLTSGFLAVAVAFGDLVGRPPAEAIDTVLFAIASAVSAARRRFGVLGSDWRIANRIVGGQLLSTNTNPPWIAA